MNENSRNGFKNGNNIEMNGGKEFFSSFFSALLKFLMTIIVIGTPIYAGVAWANITPSGDAIYYIQNLGYLFCVISFLIMCFCCIIPISKLNKIDKTLNILQEILKHQEKDTEFIEALIEKQERKNVKVFAIYVVLMVFIITFIINLCKYYN